MNQGLAGALAEERSKQAASLEKAATTILKRYGGRHGERLLTLLAAGQLTWPAIKWTRERLERHEDFTITVDGEDNVYPDLHEWVLERIPELEQKALIATTAYEIDEDVRRGSVRLRYDGSREQEVVLDSHKITVSVQREESFGGGSRNWRRMTEKIVFTAASPGGRDAIVNVLSNLVAAKLKDEKPAVMLPARWGGEWVNRGDLPERTINSVILKDGQSERIVDDLEAFLASESEYTRRYQPWHRGYLFHGPPGCGKTNYAKALANHFKMAVYHLPLGDVEKDADLTSLVGQVRERSVLLMEDIDVFSAATTRSDEGGGTTIASLLNALDGLWTPHGLVTILTTNDRAALDAALIREGRIDLDEEFTLLDEEQAVRLAEWWDPGVLTDGADFVGVSPAAMIDALRTSSQQVKEAV